MIDARYKNGAGWTFVMWNGNPYVEIYRPADLKGVKLIDAVPYFAWFIGDSSRTEGTLKNIGNGISDFAKMAE